MRTKRPAPAASWLRGAAILSLFALFLVAGCSNDQAPTEPEGTFTQVGDATPLRIAPDFCPDLPDYPVVVSHLQPADNSLFDLWFWGVGTGYAIEDNWRSGALYRGWCVEDYPIPNVQDPGTVMLYCSYDDALPGNLAEEIPINELNYLLNHKAGTPEEVQVAIWLLLGYETPSKPITPAAVAMKDDAVANGGDFVPGPAEAIAIFLYTGDGGIIGPEGLQETILELRRPDEPGGDACTPGYWKTHFDRWPDGYSPDDDFDATFGTDYFDPDVTLGEATWARGGGVNRLARHGTAALLNAAHMGVEYPYTVAEVIAMVQAGDANTLAFANEDLECPLEGTPATPGVARGD
jgi:hypothetical protein